MQKNKEDKALYMKRVEDTGGDHTREKGVTDFERGRKKQRRKI